ncbi:MAG: cyclic nucleotide-binding domain-containing protein [Chloroflexi bacterium]|uniref:Cyclic nucleotide-binding domain-containing protein n=1 Tax=Candidatus Chlorohelix allophototropha TaxID=3003348 RepID=A0A8T7LYA5_9CHLR|nr:cyclic nucleotide-binding domain-containing protein [Chloroflexota bacterium]WJW67853.1 cyclic nucleotide-binding domain-containing protein [Chloroflexota bacterium L227-S17]
MVKTTEKIEFLRGVGIFGDATDEMLQEMLNLLVDVEVPIGQTIFQKGDLGDSMFIVREGIMRVHIDEHTLGIVEKGNFFGEMAVLDSETRSASITAITNTHLWCLSQQNLYSLMSKRQEVVQGIIQLLCSRLRTRIKTSFDDFQYMQQFSKVINAAIALEDGKYQPEILDGVIQRTDPLGQLARIFGHMAQEVYNREQTLKRQVQELKIEIDQVKLAHQISQITDNDNFSDLQAQARDLRKKRFTSNKQPFETDSLSEL